MIPSIWFAYILYMLHIMSPYVVVRMVYMIFSTYYVSMCFCPLHIIWMVLLPTCMVCIHFPYVQNHVSISCSSHGFHGIYHMLYNMSSYVVAVCTPHVLHDILYYILKIMSALSPYAVLHMLWITFSICLSSCLHMLFATWFGWHSPYVVHPVSTRYSPHGFHGIYHMLYNMSSYANFPYGLHGILHIL